MSYWLKTSHLPLLPSLKPLNHQDIIIVGAGIGGLTAAYFLLKSGRSVVVLDDGPLAGGETSKSSAHITYMLDDLFSNLKKLFGLAGVTQAMASHNMAISLIEKNCLDESISCNFERLDAYLLLAQGHSFKILEEECKVANQAGFHEATIKASPLSGFGSDLAFCIPNQAQFHPVKYMELPL